MNAEEPSRSFRRGVAAVCEKLGISPVPRAGLGPGRRRPLGTLLGSSDPARALAASPASALPPLPATRPFLCSSWFRTHSSFSLCPFSRSPAARGILGSELFSVSDNVIPPASCRGSRPPAARVSLRIRPRGPHQAPQSVTLSPEMPAPPPCPQERGIGSAAWTSQHSCALPGRWSWMGGASPQHA